MMFYWLNGKFFPQETPSFFPQDRGITLGDGIFTTLKCREGMPCHWPLHQERLRKAAAVFGFPSAPLEELQPDILCALLEKNQHHQGDASARVTLTRGSGIRGLGIPPVEQQQIQVLMTTAPCPPAPQAPWRLLGTDILRNPTSPTSRFKTTNYLDNILAHTHAHQKGYDEAVFLNIQGHLVGASMGNLLFQRTTGEWVTPHPEGGCLEGITLHLLRQERSIDLCHLLPAHLEEMKSAFFLNSLRGCVPVASLTLGEQTWHFSGEEYA